MLLFGYCLIPVVWFSDSRRLVTESSVLGFRNLFGFQVTRNRSRAALVFAKCIHVLLLHFLREWHYADHPGAGCLGSLQQNMLKFLDRIMKLRGWQEHTQSIDSDPEVGKLRKLDVNFWRRRVLALFDKVYTTSLICGSEVITQVARLGGSCRRTWTLPDFQPVQRAFGTAKALPQHNIVQEIPQFGNRGDSRILGWINRGFCMFPLHLFHGHPLVANASSSTHLRLSLWHTVYVYRCKYD